MKIIAIICARGGSKRVPHKNIKLLNGKPLIAYSIETALELKIFDRVIVSTESKKIAEISKKFGAEIPFIRPKELAKGEISRWTVLQHAIRELEKRENYIPDIIIDLSPTSPLRIPYDIKKCLKKLLNKKANIITTGYKSDKNPYFNMVEKNKKGKISLVKKPSKKLTESQKAPKVYSMNDSINVIRRKSLLKNDSILDEKNIMLVEMPRERSIDIDNEFDFKIAEFIIKNPSKFKNI